MHNQFPQKINYYFITGSIPKEFGGLTTSMLHRAKLFGEQRGVCTTILTLRFNLEHNEIIDNLILKEKINPRYTKVLNMYEFYKSQTKSTHTEIKHALEEPGCTILAEKKRPAYRLFKNGMYVMFKSYERMDEKLKFIDYFDEVQNRTRREEFDGFGRIRKVTYYDAIYNIAKHELFYDENGRCYISKIRRIEDGENPIQRIYWFDINGEVKKTFKQEEDLRTYWLEQITDNTERHLFLVESRPMDPAVLPVKRDNVYTAFLFHNIHLNRPFNNDATVKDAYQPVFEDLNAHDAIIFLTNAQKTDISHRFGKRNNYFLIPHTYTNTTGKREFSSRNLKKAIVVARYSGQKQLTHAIEAFKFVHNKNQDVILELYGTGPEEQKLKELIQRLGLQKNVLLKGYTQNPKELFNTAAFTVISSKFEGFCLTILESLAHGCPVVSYDIKYGPSDMVQNGHNGYLVRPNSKKDLANKMLDLFNNIDTLKQMSENAYISSKEFGEDIFLDHWAQTFTQIVEQREKKNELKSINFNVTKSNWFDEQTNLYGIEGTLIIKGEYRKDSLDDVQLSWILENRETQEQCVYNTDIINEKNGEWILKGVLPISEAHEKNISEKNIWDLYLTLQWNNSYFKLRIGAQKTKAAADPKKVLPTADKRFIKAYYTKPHGNLSFEIK